MEKITNKGRCTVILVDREPSGGAVYLDAYDFCYLPNAKIDTMNVVPIYQGSPVIIEVERDNLIWADFKSRKVIG